MRRLAPLFPLARGGDAIQEVPSYHWATPLAPDLAWKYGGFIERGHRFDNAMFNISASEARSMDPQQRLLLEIGYDALHGSSLRRAGMIGSDLGIYVGIMHTDFAKVGKFTSVYVATASQHSIASGRLAFSLGTQGPCLSIDTACSSSIVALNSACHR